jgi:prepilin-type processing-associated H-X9-DG protein
MTMIEIITAVSILLVLVAILVPALIASRERIRRSACLSNLKQIGVTVGVYLDDHKEIFPPSIDYVPWRGSDYPGGVNALVNQKPQDIQACLTNYGLATNSAVWVCGSATEYGYPNGAGLGKFNMPDGWGYRNNITYRWNSYQTRSTLSMLGGAGNTADMNKYPRALSSVPKPSMAALMWDLPDWLSPQLHQGRINCLFVDGHVEAIVAVSGSSPPNTLWWYVGDGGGEGWGP